MIGCVGGAGGVEVGKKNYDRAFRNERVMIEIKFAYFIIVPSIQT